MRYSGCLTVLIVAAVGFGVYRNRLPNTPTTPVAIAPTSSPRDDISTSPDESPQPETEDETPEAGLPPTETPELDPTEAPPDEFPAEDEPTPIPSPLPSRPTISDLPLRWPGPLLKPVARDARIADLQQKIARYNLFAAYNQLSEIYLSAGDYAGAARTLRQEATQYRRKNLVDAAIIKEAKAARYDPSTGLYAEREVTSRELDTLYTSAPNEPLVGCYIGAFIDRDDNLKETYMDENWQTHRTANEFARVVGKPHASLFMYLGYGQKFPAKWVAELKASGVMPHIAWEPSSLNRVRDDRYLNDFALACREADWPIFIRFASEMNGKWTPYHGNPKLYREKFALVHRVLHRHAPRIATIWCVNNPPLEQAHAYYPGDAHCDWVGVNFYSVPFYENNPRRPALLDSPLTLLDPIYQRYASRKPIAICEYGASHRPAMDNKLRNEFAISKLSLLYGALPRLYPRVKLIDWFDMNSIKHPTVGKTLNDYTLTDQRAVLEAYRGAIAAPYFLGRWQRLGDLKPQLPRPLRPNAILRDAARLSVWTNFQLPGRKVLLSVGDRIVYASARPGVHEIGLDLRRFSVGTQTITVAVFDAQNRLVDLQRTPIRVAA